MGTFRSHEQDEQGMRDADRPARNLRLLTHIWFVAAELHHISSLKLPRIGSALLFCWVYAPFQHTLSYFYLPRFNSPPAIPEVWRS